ncbi:MAG: SpoIIE family protein phosphatase [Sulfurifustaceae bacterium]
MNAPCFDWGAASLVHAGETECGDRSVVQTFDDGALVAVIDALGHGHYAAEAAGVAARTLEQHAGDAPAALIERCHLNMRGLRGAAISIASFDCGQHTIQWLGIGNVTGLLVYADPDAHPRVRALLVRAGTVGDRLPALRPSVEPVAAGDMLILASDGVRTEFAEMLPAAIEPQRLADRIIDGYAKGSDDATVVIFRYNGGK